MANVQNEALHQPTKDHDEQTNDVDWADIDTSSWDSEPNTARSTRQYHPVKGEQTTPLPNDRVNDHDLASSGCETLSNMDPLSSEYIKVTMDVIGNLPSKMSPQATANRTNFEAVKQNGQASSDDDKMVNEESDKTVEGSDAEEIMEELDLTESLSHRRGELPQAQFVFMPSPALGLFGSSPFDSRPFGSLMTGLLSRDGDAFENDADVSSQSEVENCRFPGEEACFTPPLTINGEAKKKKWNPLFAMLEQQHAQQLMMQQQHHDRQVKMLQQQLAALAGQPEPFITKQPQAPLGEDASTLPERSSLTDNTPSDGRSLSSQDEEAAVLKLGESGSRSEDSNDKTLDGLGDDANTTLLTTWSDIVEQKQAEMNEQTKSGNCRESLEGGTQANADIPVNKDQFLMLQNHFTKEYSRLQEQYVSQVKDLHHHWASFQQQQQEQQQVIGHLLAIQSERVAGAGGKTPGVTDTVTQRVTHQGEERGNAVNTDDIDAHSSDETSTTYSNFTYWKQAEQDTYISLPDVSKEDTGGDQTKQRDQKSPSYLDLRSSHSDQGSAKAADTAYYLNYPTGQRRSPKGQRRSTNSSIFGEDSNLPSSVRLDLREKHARHIADLKAYYESELQDLQHKLLEATSVDDSPPYLAVARSNDRRKENCVQLEMSLKTANSHIEDLEKTIKMLEARLSETYSNSESAVASSQQKVNNLKQLCRQKDVEIQSLEKRNRELQLSLDQAYQLQDAQAKDDDRDRTVLKQVIAEYKTATDKHEIMTALLQATETQLYESKATVQDLTRTVSSLESEVRRMDSEGTVLNQQDISEAYRKTNLGSGTSANATSPMYKPPQDSPKVRHQTTPPVHAAKVASPGSGVRAVQERKHLKPSDSYNMFTGEKLVSTTSRVSGSERGKVNTESERYSSQLNGHRNNTEASTQLEVPSDEERPLSPMMKAARQFELWQSGDLADVANNNNNNDYSHHKAGIVGTVAGGTDSESASDLLSPRGTLQGGSLTSDASIHVWPSGGQTLLKSPVVPRTSKLGAALAHSSPKQLARRGSARAAVRPQDSDIFPPVRGSPVEAKPQSATSRRVTMSEVGRSGSVSPRRRLFDNDERSKVREADSTPLQDERGGLAEAVLNQMRSGNIYHTERPAHGVSVAKGQAKSQLGTASDAVRIIHEYQRKFDELMMEKRQLETSLSHVPITGLISRRAKQEEDRLEKQLERVTSELGSVRMLLRKYNALKSSI